MNCKPVETRLAGQDWQWHRSINAAAVSVGMRPLELSAHVRGEHTSNPLRTRAGDPFDARFAESHFPPGEEPDASVVGADEPSPAVDDDMLIDADEDALIDAGDAPIDADGELYPPPDAPTVPVGVCSRR